MYWEPKSKKTSHYEFRTNLQRPSEPEGSMKGQGVLSKIKNVYYFIYLSITDKMHRDQYHCECAKRLIFNCPFVRC